MGAAGIPVLGVVHPVVFGRKNLFFEANTETVRLIMTRKIFSVEAMDERHKGSISFFMYNDKPSRPG